MFIINSFFLLSFFLHHHHPVDCQMVAWCVDDHPGSGWKGMKPVQIIWAHSSNQKKSSTGEVRCVWGEMSLERGQMPEDQGLCTPCPGLWTGAYRWQWAECRREARAGWQCRKVSQYRRGEWILTGSDLTKECNFHKVFRELGTSPRPHPNWADAAESARLTSRWCSTSLTAWAGCPGAMGKLHHLTGKPYRCQRCVWSRISTQLRI